MDKYVKRKNVCLMFDRYYLIAKMMREHGECDEKLEQLVVDMKQAFLEIKPAEVKPIIRCKDCVHIETTEYGGYCCACDEGVAYNDTCPFADDGKEY